MCDDYNKPEIIIVDNQINNIKKIKYGLPKNPVEWPSMRKIDNPGGHFDVTEAIYDYVNNGNVTIPGGYLADHERCEIIYRSFVKLYNFDGKDKLSICRLIPNNPNKATYKEILIEFEDGTVCKYSKWKTIKIINWKM